jgi:hypothetical protein
MIFPNTLHTVKHNACAEEKTAFDEPMGKHVHEESAERLSAEESNTREHQAGMSNG